MFTSVSGKWTFRVLLTVLLTVSVMTAAATAVFADEPAGWKVTKKHTYYYIETEEGTTRATGLTQIGSRYFLFSET